MIVRSFVENDFIFHNYDLCFYCILVFMKILITGATGGIGSELVKDLVKDNEIIAVARDSEKLRELKDSINLDNLSVASVNVADIVSVKNVFSKVFSLDVLINCAGILGPVCLFGQSDLNNWKDVLEVNLMGVVHTTYFALPLLSKSRKGKIVNFSGGGSAYPREYHSAYGTAKTAVVRFSETVATEYPMLDVNAIAPGAYKTNIWRNETHDKEPEKWGDMDRLKKFVEFLCSEKSDGITGKFIHYKDDWENFDKNTLDKNVFTLRRVEK